MGKIIIGFNEVIELNHILQGKDLKFKIHFHDACGGQSFSVEPLGNCACEGHYEEMKKEITGYFKEKGITVKFSENHLDFILT
ncbi:MAG: hypothetical protein K0R21_1753 [Anaerocolumna sp.]|jgi:hypothetical protein|nr:hypothetical protein [Anaerocolumna sp.]